MVLVDEVGTSSRIAAERDTSCLRALLVAKVGKETWKLREAVLKELGVASCLS